MENDFGRIITLLRKERKLAQKKVAADLNISQALLSHYEKGIRHCPIDLISKFADYYDVSCDYLLGRTPDKNGQIINYGKLTGDEKSNLNPNDINPQAMLPLLNKRVISSSLNVIYGMLEDISNKSLTNEVSSYLNIAVYKMFRQLYASNPDNLECFFSLPKSEYAFLCDAALINGEHCVHNICNGVQSEKYESVSKDKIPHISYDTIEKMYPDDKNGLLNLIKSVEKKIS